MTHTLHFIDRLLRSAADRDLTQDTPRVGGWAGLVALCVGGALYGAVMGCFGGFDGDRPLQVLFSALKVPLLIGVTTALALPSFYVLNALLGLAADFAEAVRAVAVTQSAVAVVLASLCPYPALWYLSTTNYNEAILFNAVMFGTASVSAQWVLRRRYAPLIARNPRHRVMLWGWLCVYAFVGIQMGWTLRPFIGQPDRPVTFFREDTWGNAYVYV
ncbi:MAG: hypothetical protein K2V38_24275, partial [Gemmataceae bacterium]|nr:hypothetical protein [Gemmataceae bacterium]